MTRSASLKIIYGARLNALKSFNEIASFDRDLHHHSQLFNDGQRVDPSDCDRFLEAVTKLGDCSEDLYQSLLPISFEDLNIESERYKLLIKLKFLENQTRQLSDNISKYRAVFSESESTATRLRCEIIEEAQYLGKNLERIGKGGRIISQELSRTKYFPPQYPQSP